MNAGIGTPTTDLFWYTVVADKMISFSILPKATRVSVTAVPGFSFCMFPFDASLCPHPPRLTISDNKII